MPRQPVMSLLFAGLLTAIGLAALPGADAGSPRTQAVAPVSVLQAQALAAPQSRIEAETAIDDSIAGALVGAIIASFDESSVQVKLDSVDLAPLDLEQSQASGQGQLKLGDAADAPWIAFRYTALYDSVSHSASMPRLQLGGDRATATLRIDEHSLEQALIRDVASRLQAEFPQQRPQLRLHTLQLHTVGSDHAGVDAQGVVDFGAEGHAAASIEALYDPRTRRLVRLDYRLM